MAPRFSARVPKLSYGGATITGMAYDEELADRVRELLAERADVTYQRMFGGLGCMVGGNMAVAIRGQGGLLVRVDPAAHGALLAEPGADTMVMRGKAMKGWMTVTPEVCAADEALATWVARGVAYAESLPPK